MEKDYSLLRPFDLEAAKRGEKFAFIGVELEPREFIAGPDSTGTIIIKDDTGQFQSSISYPYVMLPLTWVEGRPVYKGDVLYCKNPSVKLDYKFIVESKKSNSLCTNAIYSTVGTWLHEYAMTWEKPKTKRDGWVNIVPFTKSGAVGENQYKIVRNGDIFDNYETAKQWADKCKDVLATVPISWEE